MVGYEKAGSSGLGWRSVVSLIYPSAGKGGNEHDNEGVGLTMDKCRVCRQRGREIIPSYRERFVSFRLAAKVRKAKQKGNDDDDESKKEREAIKSESWMFRARWSRVTGKSRDPRGLKWHGDASTYGG